jgi:hypothetical protein
MRHNERCLAELGVSFQLSDLLTMVPLHLPVLMAMFPGVAMLDVDQIASLTKYGKGHIYNLSSTDRLPFKPAKELGDKILVSIVEMAAYMDKTMLSNSQGETVIEPEVVKRKPGRPRGTTKSQLIVHGFQSELRLAIDRFVARSGGMGFGSYDVRTDPDQSGAAEQVPFFVGDDGLVVSYGLDKALADTVPVLPPTATVQWMTWDNALAKVWHDEESRLTWLTKSEVAFPGLRNAVKAHRDAILNKI